MQEHLKKILLLADKEDMKMCRIGSMRGFSIVELMIVIAITAILAALAVPSYFQYMANSNAASIAAQLQTSIRLAKSEAQHRGLQVKICALASGSATPTAAVPGICNTSNNSWDNGWQIVTVGTNQLVHFVQPNVTNAIATTINNIVFQPSGIPVPNSSSFTITPNKCTSGYTLNVSATGALSTGGIQVQKITCP